MTTLRLMETLVIDHADQRYNTVGDWMFLKRPFCHGAEADFELAVDVSDTGCDDYNFLVAIHELVEAYLCWKRNISGVVVDAFDFKFSGDGEPGDDPSCPYRKEHFIATTIERMLAAELGVSWLAYEKVLDNLMEECDGNEAKVRAIKQENRAKRRERAKHSSRRRKQSKHKRHRER